MTKVKYITFNMKDLETGIMFPEHISHDEFARKFNIEHKNILGAGFLDIREKEGFNIVKCYGNSISLNINSREEDSRLMTKEYFGIEALMLVL